MATYKYDGPANPHEDYTTAIILEKDDDGNVTKSVEVGGTVDLSEADADNLAENGHSFTKQGSGSASTKTNDNDNSD